MRNDRAGKDFTHVNPFFKETLTIPVVAKRDNLKIYEGRIIFVAEGELLYFSDVVIRAENPMCYVNGNEYVPLVGDVLEIENEGSFQVMDVQNQYGVFLCDLRRLG